MSSVAVQKSNEIKTSHKINDFFLALMNEALMSQVMGRPSNLGQILSMNVFLFDFVNFFLPSIHEVTTDSFLFLWKLTFHILFFQSLPAQRLLWV